MIEWQPSLERPPPRTEAQPETAGLFCWAWRYNAPMRTQLLVLCLALSRAPTALPQSPQVERPQQAKHTNADDAAKKTNSVPQVAVPPSTTVPSGIHEPAPNPEKDDPGQTKDALQKVADLVAMAVGISLATTAIYGVRVALRTLRAIEKQVVSNETAANAAKQSAEAAQNNTRVLINMERAWLVTRLEKSPPIETYRVIVGEIVQTYFVFRVENQGRTVARISGIIDINSDAYEKIPDTPHYDQLKPWRVAGLPEEGLVLPPGDSFTIPIGMGLFSQAQIDKIREGKLTLCAYCFFQYYDAASEPRDFAFCYVYYPKGRFGGDVAGFYIGGPKGYNKQT